MKPISIFFLLKWKIRKEFQIGISSYPSQLAIAALAIAPLLSHKPGLWPSLPGLALYAFMGLTLVGFFGTMFWAAHRITALSMSTPYVGTPMLAYFLGRAMSVEKRAGGLLAILTLGAFGALDLAWAGNTSDITPLKGPART